MLTRSTAKLALLFLLLSASVSQAQSVTLPKEYIGDRGEWIVVAPKFDGGALLWRWDAGLTEVVLPEAWKVDTSTAKVFKARKDGKYRLEVWTAKLVGKVPTPSQIAVTWVVIGDPQPDPGPGPEPKPPTPPTPPDPPTPVDPAPIPVDGFRVIIIEDKAKLSLMPPAQLSIRTSGVFRDYLDANCVAESGADRKAYRIWDYKTNAASDLKLWQDALNRPRTSLPWIIISNGRTGYEGPLPADVAKTIELCNKYKVK